PLHVLAPARNALRLCAHHELLVKIRSVDKTAGLLQVGAADAYNQAKPRHLDVTCAPSAMRFATFAAKTSS
ncbi:hypothetical protein, partial [Aromatoleum aromaticum]|uniref:hypothetical protein n=1 Tax=Aromatoleum aromaticum TaxID=551760 RepID=UPI001B7CFE77